MSSQQRNYISEAQQLNKSYNNLTEMSEEEGTGPIGKDKNAYLYPTMIALPLLIVIIILIASSVQLAVKILVIALILLSLIFFYMERQKVDLLKYIKKKPTPTND